MSSSITVACLISQIKPAMSSYKAPKVQTLKSKFEKLNSETVESLDITPLRVKRGPPAKFARSATCIDFSKLKLNEVPDKPVKQINYLVKQIEKEPEKNTFQRQLSNSSNSSYKSIRRSPAFRFDGPNRPSVVKNIVKEKEDPVKPPVIDEMEYLSNSLTIKKALLKPLPTGSPPKKPPRTFLSPECNKKVEKVVTPTFGRIQKLNFSPNTFPKKATKTEDKKAISSFLNCIIAPCSIDPIYLEQIKNEQKRQRPFQEETIYMEPYAHLKKDFVNNNSNRSPKPTEELHYMCTDLNPQPTDSNGNTSKDDANDLKRSSLEASDLEDYEKVNIADLRKIFSSE